MFVKTCFEKIFCQSICHLEVAYEKSSSDIVSKKTCLRLYLSSINFAYSCMLDEALSKFSKILNTKLNSPFLYLWLVFHGKIYSNRNVGYKGA